MNNLNKFKLIVMRSNLFELFSYAALCIYVLLHLNFVISSGDGVWILYAIEVLNGLSPYHDLGYVQQPFFLIYSIPAAFLHQFGIVYSKFYYLMLPLLYVAVLVLLVKNFKLGALARPLIVVSLFFISTYFNAYRFDDYHALAHFFVLLSLLLVIKYEDRKSSSLTFGVVQSVIVSLCFLTRINEGVAIGSFILLYFYVRRPMPFYKFVFIQIFTFVILLFAMLFILGDSVIDWYVSSITKAAQIKGGLSLFGRPVKLVLDAFSTSTRSAFGVVVLICLLTAFVNYTVRCRVNANKYFSYACMSVLSVLIVSFAFDISRALQYSFCFLIVVFIYKTFGMIEYVGGVRSYVATWIFYLYPLFLFLMGSLSSGGYIDDSWFPLAVLYIVIMYKINAGEGHVHGRLRFFFVLFIIAIGLKLAANKLRLPYAWHEYSTPSLITKRSLEYDGRNKPVIIDDKLSIFAKKICDTLPKDAIVFSLPFSFANYYCGNPIWQHYSQLFFDTSSKDSAQKVMNKLVSQPPDYIVYQMQMGLLAGHEIRFNGGQPLPFRGIHDFLFDKLKNNSWRVVSVIPTSDECIWLVISTSPSTP